MTKLRDSARDEECTLRITGVCNYRTDTTVLCHVRDYGHGGMGLKPPDLCAVYGCCECHQLLDRKVHNEQFEHDRHEYIARAVINTHLRMLEKGVIK